MNLKKALAVILSAATVYSPIMSVYAYDTETAVGDITSDVIEVPSVNSSTGTCGVNAVWTLDDDGTLTISGTGDMADYTSDSSAPWGADGASVKKVIIGDEITSVGEFAFYSLENLTSVAIGKSVGSVGDCALLNCSKLATITVDEENGYYSSDEYGALFNKDKTVLIQYPVGNENKAYTVPDGVESIGNGAFTYALNLIAVDIADSVTNISEGAFFGCESLRSADIGTGVVSIGYGAFAFCSSLQNIKIPSSVTSIGGRAFSDCYSLVSVTVPDSVEIIGEGAFYWCENLTSVTVGAGVKTMGDYAFAYCSNLASVTIPSSVTSIGEFAFEECSNIEYVWYDGYQTDWDKIDIKDNNEFLSAATVVYSDGDPKKVIEYGTSEQGLMYILTFGGTLVITGDGGIDASEFSYMNSISHIVIEEGVTSIGKEAFLGCSNVKTVTIPASVTSIGNGAFSDCPCIESVTVDENNGYYSSDEYGVLFDKNKTELILFPSCGAMTSYTVPDGVLSIESGAFAGCTRITSITVPSTVTSVGNGAFKGCLALLDVYHAGSINDWNNITVGTENEPLLNANVHFEKTERLILQTGACGENVSFTLYGDGELVISGIGNMTNYTTATAVPWYSNRAMIEKAVIENGVTSIGNLAFYYCTALSSVDIPNGVKTIGNSAFEVCSSLTSVTLPDDVTSIGDYAFCACKGLADITIPEGVTSIGEGAFEGCSQLTSIILPNGVKTLGERAFYQCENLECVTLGNGITNISESTFYRCSSLSSVTFGNNVKGIGNRAFYNCVSLVSVTIPDSVIRIGKEAFCWCGNLAFVDIGIGVAIVDQSAFYRCSSLKDVYYKGSEEQWNGITVGSNNSALTNANITFGTVEINAVGIRVETLPKTQYYYGEELSVEGLTVYMVYSDGSTEKIEDYTVSEYDKYSYGIQFVTITSGAFTCEYKVNVRISPTTSCTAPLAAGMTVGELSAAYSDYTVFIFDNDKETLMSDDDVIKTGCRIQLIENNIAKESISVIVGGDVTGDGIVNGKDLIRIKKQILEGGAVEYPEYADINCDGTVDENDLSALTAMM